MYPIGYANPLEACPLGSNLYPKNVVYGTPYNPIYSVPLQISITNVKLDTSPTYWHLSVIDGELGFVEDTTTFDGEWQFATNGLSVQLIYIPTQECLTFDDNTDADFLMAPCRPLNAMIIPQAGDLDQWTYMQIGDAYGIVSLVTTWGISFTTDPPGTASAVDWSQAQALYLWSNFTTVHYEIPWETDPTCADLTGVTCTAMQACPAFAYLGCIPTYDGFSYTLVHSSFSVMTPAHCSAVCGGSMAVGLGADNMCYCSNDFDNVYGYAGDDSTCNILCPGSTEFYCGSTDGQAVPIWANLLNSTLPTLNGSGSY